MKKQTIDEINNVKSEKTETHVDLKNKCKIKKYLLSLLIIGVLAYQGFEILNIYKNNDSFINVNGIAEKHIQATKAVLTIKITNKANDLRDIIGKHKEDENEIKKLLLSKFNNKEVEHIGITTNKNSAIHTDKNAPQNIIETEFVITTDKIETAKTLQNELAKYLEKNIEISTTIAYVFENIESIIESLEQSALDDTKKNATIIANASQHKLKKLHSVYNPVINYNISHINQKSQQHSYSHNEKYDDTKTISLTLSASYHIA